MRRGRDNRLSGAFVLGLALTALLLSLLAVGCGGGDSSSSIPTALEEARERLREAREKGEVPGNTGPAAGVAASAAARIEEFGSEAKGAERQAMIDAYRNYLRALAAKDYSAACDDLAEPVRKLFSRFSSAAHGGSGGGCVDAMKQVAENTRTEAGKKADGTVEKVRVEDDSGYVIFHAPGADLYQMRVARDAGEWKAGALSAPVLVPSS